MDSSRFDIFEIYKQYSELKSREYVNGIYGCNSNPDDEKPSSYKEELARLYKLAQSTIQTKERQLFDEVFKLMSQLDLMVNISEYSKFYNFVFFICRETGQKNLTVSRAVLAWRLVLAGRFRLLDQWCEFVEKNHRHNISEDTWKQVLAFTRCVHEDLEGYDPSGSWPILLDDFVEHMHSITTSALIGTEARTSDGCLPGVKVYPGLKRKCEEGIQKVEIGSNDYTITSKRRKSDDYMKTDNKNDSNSNCGCSTKGCSESQCRVHGILVKGFERLFSNPSGL